MDSLQVQVTNLSRKVDALYQITEQLSLKMSEILAEQPSNQQVTVKASSTTQLPAMEESPTPQQAKADVTSTSVSTSTATSTATSASDTTSTNLFDEYKDILLEETSGLEGGYHQGDNAITPEIQVQRLTAQLTAAYNRIAVLEEQLLSLRHHS